MSAFVDVHRKIATNGPKALATEAQRLTEQAKKLEAAAAQPAEAASSAAPTAHREEPFVKAYAPYGVGDGSIEGMFKKATTEKK